MSCLLYKRFYECLTRKKKQITQKKYCKLIDSLYQYRLYNVTKWNVIVYKNMSFWVILRLWYILLYLLLYFANKVYFETIYLFNFCLFFHTTDCVYDAFLILFDLIKMPVVNKSLSHQIYPS